MRIHNIKPNIAFSSSKNTQENISNKKTAFLIPIIVLATSPLTDSCSRLEIEPRDEFIKQDSTEVVDTTKPPLDIEIDSTYNTIIHEIEI
ncbi:MAG: hypothetical protein E7Z93_05405 [Cyanobacteria bacterium SIG32]|nr:hypothetical protein [Cyanobacteria bacterium SIG32]